MASPVHRAVRLTVRRGIRPTMQRVPGDRNLIAKFRQRGTTSSAVKVCHRTMVEHFVPKIELHSKTQSQSTTALRTELLILGSPGLSDYLVSQSDRREFEFVPCEKTSKFDLELRWWC